MDELLRQREREWDEWVRSYLEEERALLSEAIGQALAEIRAQLRDELAVEVKTLRAELNVVRARTSGEVVDLPPIIRRRADAG
jgi:hypothetical protein